MVHIFWMTFGARIMYSFNWGHCALSPKRASEFVLSCLPFIYYTGIWSDTFLWCSIRPNLQISSSSFQSMWTYVSTIGGSYIFPAPENIITLRIWTLLINHCYIRAARLMDYLLHNFGTKLQVDLSNVSMYVTLNHQQLLNPADYHFLTNLRLNMLLYKYEWFNNLYILRSRREIGPFIS